MNSSFLSNSFIGKKVAISLYKIPMLWVISTLKYIHSLLFSGYLPVSFVLYS